MISWFFQVFLFLRAGFVLLSISLSPLWPRSSCAVRGRAKQSLARVAQSRRALPFPADPVPLLCLSALTRRRPPAACSPAHRECNCRGGVPPAFGVHTMVEISALSTAAEFLALSVTFSPRSRTISWLSLGCVRSSIHPWTGRACFCTAVDELESPQVRPNTILPPPAAWVCLWVVQFRVLVGAAVSISFSPWGASPRAPSRFVSAPLCVLLCPCCIVACDRNSVPVGGFEVA